jgi:TetR/AcrR family transcriptional regulator, transcriptional repressor for nem operon
MHSTKERLIGAGLRMLLENGYNALGIQAVLDETATPKGSFYHHFKDKEDFALQVVEAYITEVHTVLDQCLENPELPPLERIRVFFGIVQQKYREEGYMGCLMGGLGQELSGVNENFRKVIECCLSSIAARLSNCLKEARKAGLIAPNSDVRAMADLLVDCWEGAALRSRLRREPSSLGAMLDFYLASVTVLRNNRKGKARS